MFCSTKALRSNEKVRLLFNKVSVISLNSPLSTLLSQLSSLNSPLSAQPKVLSQEDYLFRITLQTKDLTQIFGIYKNYSKKGFLDSWIGVRLFFCAFISQNI
jgi:hypothetical protein